MMNQNYIGWVNYLDTTVIGADNLSVLYAELSGSFCSADPVITKTFARATFFSDCRHLLQQAKHRPLILQSQEDALAALSMGQYTQKNVPFSQLEVVATKEHYLHMTYPTEVANLVLSFDRNTCVQT